MRKLTAELLDILSDETASKAFDATVPQRSPGKGTRVLSTNDSRNNSVSVPVDSRTRSASLENISRATRMPVAGGLEKKPRANTVWEASEESIIESDIFSAIQQCPSVQRTLALLIREILKCGALSSLAPVPEESSWDLASAGITRDREPRRGKAGDVKHRRKEILARVAKEHGQDEKALPEHKVLAEYGDQKFSLDGQWAKVTELSKGDRCVERKRSYTYCLVVEKDEFYTRGISVACLHHKTSCSINTTLKQQVRKERDKGQLLEWGA